MAPLSLAPLAMSGQSRPGGKSDNVGQRDREDEFFGRKVHRVFVNRTSAALVVKGVRRASPQGGAAAPTLEETDLIATSAVLGPRGTGWHAAAGVPDPEPWRVHALSDAARSRSASTDAGESLGPALLSLVCSTRASSHGRLLALLTHTAARRGCRPYPTTGRLAARRT